MVATGKRQSFCNYQWYAPTADFMAMSLFSVNSIKFLLMLPPSCVLGTINFNGVGILRILKNSVQNPTFCMIRFKNVHCFHVLLEMMHMF